MSLFLNHRLEHWAAKRADQIALSNGARIAITYSELDRLTKSQAETLRNTGLKSHSLVSVPLTHSIDNAVRVLSLMRAGCVGMLTDLRETPAELEERFSAVPLQARWSGGNQVEIKQIEVPRELKENDIRWTLFTSGSTGRSKAVMMNEENLRQRTLGEVEAFGIEPGDKILNGLTFAHDLGLNQLLSCMYAGASLTVMSLLAPGELLRLMRQNNLKGMTGTPYGWQELLVAEDKGLEISGATPAYLTISGGVLADDKFERLRRLFPKTRFIRTYGQTETFRTLIDGKPIAGVQVELTEEGELIHYGDGVMSGYLNDPESSRQKFHHSPQFGTGIATGDFFEKLVDGTYGFRGRRDDIVKIKDHRVSLLEVENAIREFKGVREVAFVRVADSVAFVTLEGGVGADDVLSYCKKRLSRHKVPDRLVVLTEFPRTNIGKIDKVKLREMT